MLQQAEQTTAKGLIEITPQQAAERRARDNAVIIDVREPDEFAAESIPGAINIPLSRFSPDAIRAAVPHAHPDRIILHCRSGVRSAQAAAALIAAGWTSTQHIAGGINAWKLAGLERNTNNRAPISIMRQVQITAGSLVALGTLAGVALSPWALFLPGFVGAGLVFAGISGTCGMASLLAKMPWNRAITSTAQPPGACAAK